ncbi:thioredoxin reductase [Encephalitozoon intestinalis ATCC 50506]|uniref:Thioredoxin reductase n=1 Tax=Encephalitozoon intestinalis (strain ATCC 50506) TaxID=876142 RepID=E0S5D4_ENCIT|nr:thioredoxin reductase [Encephalitozoon intestinalis ATCC 50506]ADM10919.1 thioredoxin reductase [Encephalitozoon intestinalis ATCC 50506]UTX44553.1 thioredoxin reductase [Encephalitozoon intestinalis]
MRSVIIIGQGPGTYMCGIYIHTANLSPLILKVPGEEEMDFSGAENVVGVKDVQEPKEFISLVESQARNMGIEVLEEEVVEILREDDYFAIKTNAGLHKTRSLVIDSRALEGRYRPLLGNRGVFYVNDKVPYREAIILAGAGCKISFDVKEFINSIK